MTEAVLSRLRAAIDDDPRTVHAIAVEARVPAPVVYRFIDGKGIGVETASKIGAVVGLRIETVCEPIVNQSSNRSS